MTEFKIIISVVPNIEIGKPPVVEMHADGIESDLDVLAILDTAQRAVIARMIQARNAYRDERIASELQLLEKNSTWPPH